MIRLLSGGPGCPPADGARTMPPESAPCRQQSGAALAAANGEDGAVETPHVDHAVDDRRRGVDRFAEFHAPALYARRGLDRVEDAVEAADVDHTLDERR